LLLSYRGRIHEMAVPNPNGANGITSDPREQIAWDFYVKSLMSGKENAYQSALDAGYAIDTARNITMNDWFKERLGKLRRKDMLSKAERNLDRVLETDYEDDEGNIKSDVMRIVVDVSKTIVTTLGKDDGYSSRSELTGKDGNAIEIDVKTKENSNSLLSAYLSSTGDTKPTE
jgi:hypothetical protein